MTENLLCGQHGMDTALMTTDTVPALKGYIILLAIK